MRQDAKAKGKIKRCALLLAPYVTVLELKPRKGGGPIGMGSNMPVTSGLIEKTYQKVIL